MTDSWHKRAAGRRHPNAATPSPPITPSPYHPTTLRSCIDLAVRCGLPPMLDVTRAVAEELQVEELVVADELLTRDEALPAALRDLFPEARLRHISHRELKRLSERARAVVRTGECTPYHNVVLVSGVTF
ncbi:MAG: RbsD/FucU domain-containing protein [Thermomicrobiales bacterium]